MKTILEDEREIKYIDWDNGDCCHVGHCGVTKITVYEEKGPGDFIPYVAVWKDDNISIRIAAWAVSINYMEKTDEESC